MAKLESAYSFMLKYSKMTMLAIFKVFESAGPKADSSNQVESTVKTYKKKNVDFLMINGL